VIAFLALCYSAFYVLFFNKLKWFEKSARNISIFVGIGVTFIGAIVFAWWSFAPTAGDGRMYQFVVPIVPNVGGQVIAVPVEPLQPLKRGDLLYQIDPEPYQYKVDQMAASIEQAKAQKQLAEIQVKRSGDLVRASAGAQSELDRWNAELAAADASIASLQAQFNDAQWRLDQTNVLAPWDGYVINIQLRPGAVVSNMPVAAAMSFVSDEKRTVLASLSQSASRYVAVGDAAEVVFTSRPGQVYPGKVTHVLRVSGTSQELASGQLPTMTGEPETGRWAIRVHLDDAEAAAELPQSAAGMVAVYTERGKPFHVISKVVMRMQAWMGYLTSP
jgi:RND family efflux transporter MFP subunit